MKSTDQRSVPERTEMSWWKSGRSAERRSTPWRSARCGSVEQRNTSTPGGAPAVGQKASSATSPFLIVSMV
ncbi:hypothetical protein [Streptomyces sp. NPDC059743]|uniref:hypothetical protein n=1 Tax=Streptomyces sp. NPDC059743 TaxID=3346928 RepID=UPI003668DFF7